VCVLQTAGFSKSLHNAHMGTDRSSRKPWPEPSYAGSAEYTQSVGQVLISLTIGYTARSPVLNEDCRIRAEPETY
jgi:hypothetical protein